MIFKGTPNQRVSLTSFNDLFFVFDENGKFDTKNFVSKIENDLIARLKIHFEPDEKQEEIIPEEEKTIFTCKKCEAQFDNRGLFLAHMREHKKDGE